MLNNSLYTINYSLPQLLETFPANSPAFDSDHNYSINF